METSKNDLQKLCAWCRGHVGRAYMYGIVIQMEMAKKDDGPVPNFCSENCLQKWGLLNIPDFLSWMEAKEIGVVLS